MYTIEETQQIKENIINMLLMACLQSDDLIRINIPDNFDFFLCISIARLIHLLTNRFASFNIQFGDEEDKRLIIHIGLKK